MLVSARVSTISKKPQPLPGRSTYDEFYGLAAGGQIIFT
jgi:hypothetical protein